MNEIWKKTHIDIYSVSNRGDVRNDVTGHILSRNKTNGNGYIVVSLRGKNYYPHRLVSIFFIENPDNLPCVNHKDGNKKNNDVSNLEWCTALYNIQHSINVLKHTTRHEVSPALREHLRLKNIGTRMRSENHMSKPVRCVETGEVFSCAADAAESRSKSRSRGSLIGRACYFVNITVYGFHWEFINSNVIKVKWFKDGRHNTISKRAIAAKHRKLADLDEY